MLNIVGSGMRGAKFEDNQADMDGDATAKMALKYPASSSASRPRTTPA